MGWAFRMKAHKVSPEQQLTLVLRHLQVELIAGWAVLLLQSG
jgi:hypothetical protein